MAFKVVSFDQDGIALKGIFDVEHSMEYVVNKFRYRIRSIIKDRGTEITDYTFDLEKLRTYLDVVRMKPNKIYQQNMFNGLG